MTIGRLTFTCVLNKKHTKRRLCLPSENVKGSHHSIICFSMKATPLKSNCLSQLGFIFVCVVLCAVQNWSYGTIKTFSSDTFHAFAVGSIPPLKLKFNPFGNNWCRNQMRGRYTKPIRFPYKQKYASFSFGCMAPRLSLIAWVSEKSIEEV